MPQVVVVADPDVPAGRLLGHVDTLQSSGGIAQRPGQHRNAKASQTHLCLHGPAGAGEYPRRPREPVDQPGHIGEMGLGRALFTALAFYSIGAFFLLLSVYLQDALHVSALDAGLVFLPFGAGFLLGPLSTPCFRRRLGEWVNPVGMGLETAGFLGLAWLISATPDSMAPASTPLAVLLFLIGFGQGLAMPTLMTMITGRVAPAYSGMIAGIASSTLQVSTALSVALIGGIFYTVLGGRDDPAAISHAFIVAALCIACCLGAGVVLGMTLARRTAASTQGQVSGA